MGDINTINVLLQRAATRTDHDGDKREREDGRAVEKLRFGRGAWERQEPQLQLEEWTQQRTMKSSLG